MTENNLDIVEVPRGGFRMEHDLIGDREVPVGVYWGIHTLRAVENFPITGQTLGSNTHLITGLAMVKQAAAQANHELGLLHDERDFGAFVHFSGVLKRVAVKLSKICNDLRLLSSGPRGSG